jgi:oligopeptide/dipeptide ABC transporter ATP-binding protein
MQAYLARRLLALIPALFFASLIVFVIVRLVPGSIIDMMLSQNDVADPEVEARRPRTVIFGEVPSALRPPPGCSFHTRCPRAMAVCKIDQPLLRSMGGERTVACHLHAS